MHLFEQANQSRYAKTSSLLRNGKLAETASTAFGATARTTFRMRRTSSFTTGNVKCRLDIFQSSLDDLQAELRDIQADTSRSREFANQLSVQLTDRLAAQKTALSGSVRQMKASMEKQKQGERERVHRLRERCGELSDGSLGLRNRFEGLKSRIQEMERAMGYYGGNEKFRS